MKYKIGIVAFFIHCLAFAPTTALAGPGEVVALSVSLPEGFSELRSTQAGVVGTFDWNGTTITIETRRGPMTPEELRSSDAKTPRFEIDVRILDRWGFPVFTQVGGHGPIDETWAVASPTRESAFVFAVPSDVEARASFRATEHALQALSKTRFRTSLEPEREALVSILPLVRTLFAIEKFEGEFQETSPESSITASSCTYKHRIEIHDAACCFNNITGARHSATIAKMISSSGTVTQVWSSSNHGRNASDMATKCSWTSSANRCSLSMSAYMCSTPLNYTGICKSHVCNDDTKIQYDTIRYAYSPSPNSGTCSDCTLLKVPPSCP